MDEKIVLKIGDFLSDDQAMRWAMQEARKGAGFVSPNPPVGCVILDAKNKFLSSGYHKKFGGPHAEVEALADLNPEQLKGARIFVTLEPCAHEGKTPSCAKKLATLPIAEVIYGLIDPNPQVAGQGVQILEDAGIRVRHFDSLQAELEEVCEHFLMNFRENKIFVSVKVASSLDGQLALQNFESQWITGSEAREFGHRLRATHDAVMVGKNTVFQDDPMLTVRHPEYLGRKTKLVVLDSEGEIFTKPELKVFKHHTAENLIVVMDNEAKPRSNAHKVKNLVKVGKGPGGVNLTETYQKLWDLGVRSILVEGGAEAISSHIMQDMAHRLYLFQAPILLGAKGGIPWSRGVTINSMDHRITIRDLKTRQLGSDLLLTGRF